MKLRLIEEKDGTKSFEIAATFSNSEAGFWEVVPKKETELTFDNMVVGYQKAGDKLLKVTCSSHQLKIGDEVQVTGTREYDGLYPVKAVDEVNDAFTIDLGYQPGEAVDLKAKKRRGICFGGSADYLRTGTLELPPFAVDTDGGRIVSAWVWLESAQSQAQLIVGQDDQAIELGVDTDNKVQLKIHCDDNSTHDVKDPDALPLKTWVHYAGTVELSGPG
ncbi:LamG domain-containing protein [Candidatus Thiosymbion oneisti]|uniref:LamG domain-containing protein n=1 Tax=Candidatus Thiosymbion oneisti TaxID=589554 RepID=UPI00114CA148|nr:LamG domain-containing protein [Candidatus Thiosymbion oneisti]